MTFGTHLVYSLESLQFQYFESHGCLSTLVPSSFCTFYHNALFFKILWSCHIFYEDIPSWPCLRLFSVCSSVFFSSSHLLHCWYSSNFWVIHFLDHFVCNSWYFFIFCYLSWPNHSLYLTHISSYYSTALPYSSFHINLHHVLLEHCALPLRGFTVE